MFKSKFSGAKIDELLEFVNDMKTDPSNILKNVSEKNILDKLTAQGLIDKINTVDTSINFKKYVDCQAGAGKTT